MPAPGHHLGFNDIKTIEVRALLTALAGGPPFQPDFREAWEIQRVVDAIVDSARERSGSTVGGQSEACPRRLSRRKARGHARFATLQVGRTA